MACKNKKSSKEEKKHVFGKNEFVHNINIGNMILNVFKSRPNFISQIDAATEEKTTFWQMRENSVKCALWLQKSCYKNVVISICTHNQMLAYIPFLAGLYTNALINPWDRKYFEEIIRIMYFLVEYEPEVIFIDSNDYEELVRAILLLNKEEEVVTPPKIITFDKIENVDSLESILNGDFDQAEIDKFSCEETKPMSIMANMFSPSATSYPGKTHVRYMAFTYPSNQEMPAMSPDDIGLWYGSLVWPYNLILIVRSIVSYVTVIKSSKFTDEDMCKVIEKYKVKWVFLESDMCDEFFQASDISMYDISSLKQLVFADSAIHCDIYENLIKKFTNVSVIQVYNIPEACITATYQRSNNSNACSGYLAKNVQLMVLDLKTKEIIGSDKLGEIWYRLICKWCNPTTCESPFCYNYKAEKDSIDAEAFADNQFINTWHCTGDYGYFEKDGTFFIIDKLKHLIKYKTHDISPLRIETVLQRHPAVSEVIVRFVLDPSDGQHPKAYVKIKNEVKVSEAELKDFVEKSLPDTCKLRGGVRFVKEMPYLPNGKIDRVRVVRDKNLKK